VATDTENEEVNSDKGGTIRVRGDVFLAAAALEEAGFEVTTVSWGQDFCAGEQDAQRE